MSTAESKGTEDTMPETQEASAPAPAQEKEKEQAPAGQEAEEGEEQEAIFDAPLVLLELGSRRVKGTLKIPQVRLQESVVNLKQLLRDVPELCHISNSCHLATVPAEEVAEHLQKKSSGNASKKKKHGQRKQGSRQAPNHPFQDTTSLDESAILAECETLAKGDYLVLVPDAYTSKTAWEHVNHVREILRNPPGPLSGMSGSVPIADHDGQEALSDEDALATAAKIPDAPLPVPVNLESFYSGEQQDADGVRTIDVVAELTRPHPVCAREIVPSGWNPVPSNRRLLNDFFYLRIASANDNVVHVTACKAGFFQNSSTDTVFNPEVAKNSPTCPTLVELLASVLPGFLQQYKALLASAEKRNEALLRSSGLSEPDVTSITTNINLPLYYAEANRAPIMPHPQGQWNDVVDTPHPHDRNRASQVMYDTLNMAETVGNPRDWNEEYQGLLEMPVESLDQRIARARLLEALHNDFADNARRGAVALVEGSLLALNPSEAPESHVYVFNNVFLSVARMEHGFGIDAESKLDPALNPVATYCGSNHDLQAIKSINYVLERQRLNEPKPEEPGDRLHTLNTVLVDFQGHRIIAQSLVPGILQNDHAKSLLYGSIDFGAKINAKAEIADDVTSLMKSLYIEGGRVKPSPAGEETDAEADAELTLSAPVTSKGLRGADGRRYILDVTRTTPLDLNHYQEKDLEEKPLDETQYVALLRPELVQQLVDTKRRAQEVLRRQAAETIYADFEKEHGKQTEEEPWSAETTSALEQAIRDAREKVPDAKLPKIDSNLFTVHQPKEFRDEQVLADARELAEFLVETQLPSLVTGLRTGALTPSDGAALVTTMHNFGINVRYIGQIAEGLLEAETTKLLPAKEGSEISTALPAAAQALNELCEIEMVARSCKWIFRRVMLQQETADQTLATTLVRLLNAVLGKLGDGNAADDETSSSSAEVEAWLLGSGSSSSFSAGARQLRQAIRASVKQHFGYELRWWWAKEEDAETSSKENQEEEDSEPEVAAPGSTEGKNTSVDRAYLPALLRRICQVCGIRVASRNYVFEAETPFFETDMVDVIPVIKTSRPEWCLQEVRDRIAAARSRISVKAGAPQELHTAYQLSMEALNMVCQIEGPVHRNALSCIMTVSDILRIVRDIGGAISQHRRALALAQVLGSRDTDNVAAMHLALGSLYHMQHVYDCAVEHLRRAAYLFELMAGPRAQQLSAIYQRLATIYLEIGEAEKAFACANEAMSRCGDDKHQIALLCHLSAQAMAGLQCWTQSLEFERSAYAIFKTLYGPKSPRTTESAQTVKALTQRCVDERRASQQQAEEQAQLEKKRLRAIKASAKKKKGKAGKKK
ncbi:Clustered mitochondria protein-like [Hondaea fermentalgiana]|uniref:Clustered mitochondria protein-like n=1 Tax=Hondaea fermentalgiana TaxID=2315210 RepID=A0A2R5G865_9STRA|nr:Clustered mitochondria protein-like [Hondaea fermentalgiana]|eukprot:GBG24231.1 Clustered mitochondria protein-like [Hondaea fermentalgiana]